MKLIDQLTEYMGEIERKDDWAFNFIESIKIKKEEDPNKKLTGAQFKKLCEIHTKYCGNR